MSLSEDKYKEAGVYYRVVYPDVGLLYPMITSFVFIGMNLSSDDKEDTWYFQFADGYARNGSVLTSSNGSRKVTCIIHKEFGSMLNVTELNVELSQASSRREKGKK